MSSPYSITSLSQSFNRYRQYVWANINKHRIQILAGSEKQELSINSVLIAGLSLSHLKIDDVASHQQPAARSIPYLVRAPAVVLASAGAVYIADVLCQTYAYHAQESETE